MTVDEKKEMEQETVDTQESSEEEILTEEQAPEEEKPPAEEAPAEEKTPYDEASVEETADGEAAAEETPAEETADAATETPEKKSFFGRKKEKKDKRDEQIADLTDKLKRQLAEFENFRNRTEKEKSQMYSIGASSVLEKILPVLDSFERGLKTIPEEQKDDPVASGMEMIYKQLVTALTDLGMTPIEAVGQEFDPNLHNAVMHVDDEELGENVVAEEFQKGYKYRDAVLRHSMVKVAN
ncbi:MAG: nucleotide exchange factor GrpE [Lachnospiraceae bacterium]|nr:nucleotide exchange factor GrpE [Lachnospiraceae bacterium]